MATSSDFEITKQMINGYSTPDLLEVWQKNNREEWSGEEMAYIHALLLERLGTVPEQPLPDLSVYEQELCSAELGVGKIMAHALRIYGENFLSLLAMTIWLLVPFFLFSIFITLALSPSVQTWLLPLNVLLTSAAAYILYLAVIFMVEKNIQDQGVTFSEIAQHVRSRLFSAIGTSIVVGAWVAVLSLLFIVPGFIMAVKCVFTDFAMLLRGRDNWEAVQYSQDLVKDRWFKTLGMHLLLFLFWVIPYLIVSLVLGFAAVVVGIFTQAFIPQIIFDSALTLASSLLAYQALIIFRIMQTVWFLNWDYRRNFAAVSSPNTLPF